MSYELVNQSTILSRTFSKQFWAKALELARLYGWEPRGTQPPSDFDYYKPITDWHGTYLTNDGQVVKTDDARLLAEALERSLADLPETHPSLDLDPRFWRDDDLPEWFSPQESAMIEDELQDGLLDILGIPPLTFFAGDEKRHLKDFIRFCRLGSFIIF